MTEISPTPALSAQELYQLEKSKRGDRIAPAMAEAAAELKRQQELAVIARKGGRPKGADLKLGKQRTRRAPTLGFEDGAPGRPDRLALTLPDAARRDPSIVTKAAALLASPVVPRPPLAAQPPSSEPSMAKTFAPRHCLTCKTEFTPRGPTHRYCTDACNPNNAGESAPPRKPAAKKATKKDKTEKKRPRVETGFNRQVTALKGKSAYGDTIASMLAEADMLEVRRTRLLAAVEHLELLGRPA